METSEWLTINPEENLTGALEEIQTKLKNADIPKDSELFFDSVAEILDMATSAERHSKTVEVIDLISQRYPDLFKEEIVYYLNWVTESLLALNQKERLVPYIEATLTVDSKYLAEEFLFKILPRLMRADCFGEVYQLLSCHWKFLTGEADFLPHTIEELQEYLYLAVLYESYSKISDREDESKAQEIEARVRQQLASFVDLAEYPFLKDQIRILLGRGDEPEWKAENFCVSSRSTKEEKIAFGKKARLLGYFFLLWLRKSEGIPLGLADAYRRAALRYLFHQSSKKRSSYLSIRSDKIEASLVTLTRELFTQNWEMLDVYLAALPFFSSFLVERNLVEKGEAEAVQKETQRLRQEIKSSSRFVDK